MDLQEIKNYFKNKNETDKLTKQVRDLIKTSAWEKQDMREGFKETFTPLIQSQESIKKSIDEQKNKTLEELKKNQLALTDKENKLDQLLGKMLAIMEGEQTTGEQTTGEQTTGKQTTGEQTTGEQTRGEESRGDKDKTKTITPDFFDRYLSNKKTQEVLENYNFDRLPSSYYNSDAKEIYEKLIKISNEMNNIKKFQLTNTANIRPSAEGYYIAEPINNKPQKKTKFAIETYNELSKYFYQMNQLYKFKTTIGKGMTTIGKGMTYYNNPLQLLDRLELLGGSIIAGNNGVINEFSQIAHLLAQMSVITKKQLNELLQNYVFNR